MSANQHYTVYDNITDMPVAVNAPAMKCAKAMGIKFKSFYSTLKRCRDGTNKRWTILTYKGVHKFSMISLKNLEYYPEKLYLADVAEILGITEYYAQKLFMREDFPGLRVGKKKAFMVLKKRFVEYIEGCADEDRKVI